MTLLDPAPTLSNDPPPALFPPTPPRPTVRGDAPPPSPEGVALGSAADAEALAPRRHDALARAADGAACAAPPAPPSTVAWARGDAR